MARPVRLSDFQRAQRTATDKLSFKELQRNKNPRPWATAPVPPPEPSAPPPAPLDIPEFNGVLNLFNDNNTEVIL